MFGSGKQITREFKKFPAGSSRVDVNFTRREEKALVKIYSAERKPFVVGTSHPSDLDDRVHLQATDVKRLNRIK